MEWNLNSTWRRIEENHNTINIHVRRYNFIEIDGDGKKI